MKSKKKVVKSNLRWPGGKSKMTRILDKYMPDEVNRYLEVFTGGGSVLLQVLQKYEPVTSYANDIEKGLIAYYERVRTIQRKQYVNALTTRTGSRQRHSETSSTTSTERILCTSSYQTRHHSLE